MPNIKFGRKQIENPTPTVINWWVRFISIVASTFSGWLFTVDFVGPKSKNIMMGISALVVLMCNALAPMFGTKPRGKYVRSKDVSALDTEGGDGEGGEGGNGEPGGSSDPDPSHPKPPKP